VVNIASVQAEQEEPPAHQVQSQVRMVIYVYIYIYIHIYELLPTHAPGAFTAENGGCE